jgi:hypothetical protein
MKKLLLSLLLSCICFSFTFAGRNDYHKHRYGYGYGKIGYYDKHTGIGISVGSGYGYYPQRLHYYSPYSGYDTYYYNREDSYDYLRAKEEVNALEAKKTAAQAAKKELSSIRVPRAKFYKQYFSDKIPASMAEITVENGSGYLIKKIYFRGELKTHITNKTLINETFSYTTANTLDSLERATYKISLNEFGGWAKAKPPDMAIFTVTVEGIETYDGKLLDVNGFTLADQKRLNALKDEY